MIKNVEHQPKNDSCCMKNTQQVSADKGEKYHLPDIRSGVAIDGRSETLFWGSITTVKLQFLFSQ